ncbi:hypothetical protein OU790_11950 [Ruegeria sp. NA]|nr:hypothetical protein [Ruegeria sp. NA]MCX8954147.1 hypothetical protein [Ruegeria sp. NA]
MEIFDVEPVIIRPDDGAALGRFRKLIEVRVSALNLSQVLLPEIDYRGVRIEIPDQPVDQSLDDLIATLGSEYINGRLQTLQRIDWQTHGENGGVRGSALAQNVSNKISIFSCIYDL